MHLDTLRMALQGYGCPATDEIAPKHVRHRELRTHVAERLLVPSSNKPCPVESRSERHMTKSEKTFQPAFRALCAITGSRELELVEEAGLDESSWQDIVALALRHRVEGLVARAFADGKIEAPMKIRRHFSNCARGQALVATRSAKALRDISQALENRLIPFVLLKGLDVAERYYTSWADRQSIDIDLLVPEAKLCEAERALNEIGFSAQSFQKIPQRCRLLAQRLRADLALERRSDDIHVELHYRLFPNPYLLPMSFAELYDRSVPLSLGHAKVRVFKPDALLNYLVIHGAKHGWFRLKWLADLDKIVPAMSDAEFQQATDFAARAGCERLLATSLNLLHRIYGSAPTRTRAPQFAFDVDEKLLAKMLIQLRRSEVRTAFRLKDLRHWLDSITLDFALRRSWRYRLRQIELLLIDPRDIETFRLSSRWRPVYFVVGPFAKMLRSVARSI